MKKSVKIKNGYECKDTKTGNKGVIADIQYVHNRYQFENLSGWQYGIENLVILP